MADSIQFQRSDTSAWVSLPVNGYQIGGEDVVRESVMASGRIVRDVIGCRKVISVTYPYIESSKLTALMNEIRSGGFLNIKYTDVDGNEKQAKFKSSVPTPRVFKYNSGTPVWVDVSMTLTAQEVV